MPVEKETIRTFVCIEIPQSILSRIGELQSHLRTTQARVSWVNPSNIHLTIKFLGSVPAMKIPAVVDAVAKAAHGVSEFELRVEGTGCFPSPKRPRGVWVGIAGFPEPLKQLHQKIDLRLSRVGFPRETRPVSPHLTTGRLRAPDAGAQLAEQMMSLGFAGESVTVKEVITMKSDLKPTGSIYTPLGRARLVAISES